MKPEPSPDDAPNADTERHIDVTPGEPVSIEVPSNTNLVINVVTPERESCLSSLFSGLSCVATGFVILVIVFWIIGSFTP